MAFQSLEDVDRFIEKRQGSDGVEALRTQLDTGRFHEANAIWARAWLARHDRQRQGVVQSSEQVLMERQAIAAEVAAEAALQSTRIAKGAGITAVLALIVSVLALIKQ